MSEGDTSTGQLSLLSESEAQSLKSGWFFTEDKLADGDEVVWQGKGSVNY